MTFYVNYDIIILSLIYGWRALTIINISKSKLNAQRGKKMVLLKEYTGYFDHPDDMKPVIAEYKRKYPARKGYIVKVSISGDRLKITVGK